MAPLAVREFLKLKGESILVYAPGHISSWLMEARDVADEFVMNFVPCAKIGDAIGQKVYFQHSPWPSNCSPICSAPVGIMRLLQLRYII